VPAWVVYVPLNPEAVAKRSAAARVYGSTVSSRPLKNEFFNGRRCGTGMRRHFSNTPVFEKWSEAEAMLWPSVVEKVREGLFQLPARALF
jgi:hypothetical protein